MKSVSAAPVVISHFNGSPRYLGHALRAAARHNRRVVLLGDSSNTEVWPDSFDCSGKDTSLYSDFRRVFRKMSFYADAYETAFWKRLFMLELWMSEGGHPVAVLLDSDVVTFADLSRSMAPFLEGSCDVGLMTPHDQQDGFHWASSCHVSYWSLEALGEFLTFCVAAYGDGPRRADLEAKWEWHQANRVPGGVSEMTLLYLWARNRARVGNFAQAVAGATFDLNLNDSTNYWREEYGMRRGLKAIDFADGGPYAVNLHTRKRVDFHCLHCQGGAKRLMGYLASPLAQHWWQHEPLISRIGAGLRIPFRLMRSLARRVR